MPVGLDVLYPELFVGGLNDRSPPSLYAHDTCVITCASDLGPEKGRHLYGTQKDGTDRA